MHIQILTFPAYLTSLPRHELPFAYAAWFMDYPDPRNFLEPWFGCASIAETNSTNAAYYCDAETDRLLALAAVEGDPARRAALYREAQGRILEAAPVAVEYHSLNQSVTLPIVKGFQVHPIWPRDMTKAWLDLPSGRETP
jgi:ABC-type transport system substrate-binding protein